MQTYTKAQLAEILDKHKKWLADEEGGKRANFRNANLSNADLSCANLSNADLSCADLSCANLRNANLSNAYLSNANLSNVDLSNTTLSYATLSYATLSYANLSDAILSNATLGELRSLRGTIGNGSEIKTVQTGQWIVTYTPTQMQIGCMLNSIEQWWNFSDEEIAQMDKLALDWWQVWKPILKQHVTASPAVASAVVAE